MDNTLKILEYQSVLDWLSNECQSEAAKELALNLTPSLSQQEMFESWDIIEEAQRVILIENRPDFYGHLNLSNILALLKIEGAILNPEELTMVLSELNSSKLIKSFFNGLEESFPLLQSMAEEISVFPEIINDIERTVGPDGEILDTASTELARLRLEQNSTRAQVSGKLNNLMRSENFKNLIRDDIITTRSDRFVVPVRASAASNKRGLVHDWSQTGATAFLEPLEIVEDNNKLGFLKKKEKQEIERILNNLSRRIRQLADAILVSGKILSELDLIFAKAALAESWDAIKPDYQESSGFNLISLRHPLLDRRLKAKGERMFPIDMHLGGDEQIMVISGLNTGGKTVAMKTLGLAMLAAKTGLLIPAAKGSVVNVPELIMAVMGDEQDLSSDLSTFSGHLQSLKKILSLANPKSLILLDEIGSGTDPTEGAALGLAILEELLLSNALVITATHYHMIKTWATLTDGVIAVAVNATDYGKPLYGLSYGAPGFSGGLKMAENLGLPDYLVQRAASYIDDAHKKSAEMLQKMDNERAAIAVLREELEEEKRLQASISLDLKKQRESLIDKYQDKVKKQDMEIKSALSSYSYEFKRLIKELEEFRNSGQNLNPVSYHIKKSSLDKQLRQALPKPLENLKTDVLEKIEPEDELWVKKLGKSAIVKIVNYDKKEAWVDANGLNVLVSFDDLTHLPESMRKKASKVKVTLTTKADDALSSINLLGHTVEEAIDLIEKELDRAFANNRKTLNIIHGFGTGRLKQGIRAYLLKHPKVKNFNAAAPRDGGDGVTIAQLYE